jgi:hypothetical protein
MQPVDIQLPDHTAGDTWEGLTIGPVLFNDAQPAQALSSCRLYFRRQSGGGWDTSSAQRRRQETV